MMIVDNMMMTINNNHQADVHKNPAKNNKNNLIFKISTVKKINENIFDKKVPKIN